MIMEKRSSLELMLEKIQQMEDQPEPGDVPPALPNRPVTKARLPRSRRQLPFSSQTSISHQNGSVDMIPSLEEIASRNKKTKVAGFDFDQVVNQQESAGEMIGMGESEQIMESVDEPITQGYDRRNNTNGVVGKVREFYSASLCIIRIAKDNFNCSIFEEK